MFWVDLVHGQQPSSPKELYLILQSEYQTDVMAHGLVEKSGEDETSWVF